jgi:hypothetical protein
MCLLESCQKYLCLICFKETLQLKKSPALNLRQIQLSHLPFYRRKNACLVEGEKNNKVKARCKNAMDFSKSHKTKGKTAISRIGTMISMADFSSLCINMNMIITAICSSIKPQLILHQILLNFIAIVNNPNWMH